MAFTRRTGKRNVKTFNSAGTITAGDVVQYDENGEVVVGATGAEILGIALQSATSSDTVDVDLLKTDDEVEALIETGTMAQTEVGEEADINSADGLTLTESNNDFLISGWDGTTTTICYGTFKNLAHS